MMQPKHQTLRISIIKHSVDTATPRPSGIIYRYGSTDNRTIQSQRSTLSADSIQTEVCYECYGTIRVHTWHSMRTPKSPTEQTHRLRTHQILCVISVFIVKPARLLRSCSSNMSKTGNTRHLTVRVLLLSVVHRINGASVTGVPNLRFTRIVRVQNMNQQHHAIFVQYSFHLGA